MDAELQKLIELAREIKSSSQDREAQRVSFAFGNSHLENEDITRDTVIRESANLRAEEHVR